jgi:hypothetical protein
LLACSRSTQNRILAQPIREVGLVLVAQVKTYVAFCLIFVQAVDAVADSHPSGRRRVRPISMSGEGSAYA